MISYSVLKSIISFPYANGLLYYNNLSILVGNPLTMCGDIRGSVETLPANI